MNAIIGMSTIGKSAEELEMKNYAFGKIETASSQLLDLINNILDMAKIEEGKMALFPAEYSFEEMLAKVLAVIRVASDEKNQIITVKADDKIPTFLIGDDLRLSQVITNILANAVKFTPEGGSIHLEAALAGETGGICELRVEIADNGIGLSPEHMDTLFDAFEQAESGTTRAYGGTGLGLAISKRIVEAMGGSIRVESEPEKGAKFIFTVHAGRGTKNSAGTPERPSGGTLRGKKMLAVEDMATNRTVLKMLLKDSGLDIEFAVNGKEAVEMVSAEPDRYDIIFMDVRMPEMNGLDATRHIRALPPRKRGPLPIIAMTANVFKEDIDACLESGMDEHLGKPVDIEKTMEVLHKYLGN
jgi:CheY-like chemotaxis protein/two-component sensor histidine kinase